MTLAGALTLNLGWLLIFTTALRLVEWVKGWRRVRFTVCAWFGLFAYMAIHVLLELYRVAAGIYAQIMIWQMSLILTAVMFMGLLWIVSGKALRDNILVWLTAAVCISLPLVPAEAVVTQKFAEFTLSVFILALCLECFLALGREDAMARTIWQVLLVALLVTSLQILDCQLLNNPFAPREEGSSCEQIYGWTVTWMPTLITSGGMALILWQHRSQE